MQYTVTDLGMDASRSVIVPHGSNSQRVGYTICPAAFRYGRIEKYAEVPTSDQIRGTGLHAGLAATLMSLLQEASREDALQAGYAALRGHLKEQFAKASKHGILWLPRFKDGPTADPGSLEEDVRDSLPLLLDTILERFTILTVEHGFLVHFEDCDPVAAFADIVGIDKLTGELVVLDVKTGLKMKSLSDLIEDDAQIIYAAGTESVMGERPARLGYACVVFGGGKKGRTIRVGFVVDDEGKIGIPYEPERLRRVATHQRALAAAKAHKLYLPMQTTWACARCPFIIACEKEHGPTGVRRKGEIGVPIDEEQIAS